MKKKFIIECEMEERWINQFLSMLNLMEYNSNVGKSRIVSFYSDGDGDFCPKFKPNIDYTEVEPKVIKCDDVLLFDAG